MRKAWTGGLWAMAALWLASGAAARVVTGDQVEVTWEAASGPVAGYYVIVWQDGTEPALAGISFEPRSLIRGEPGQVLVVQVAAFTPDGEVGPLSARSETLEFARPEPAPAPRPDPEPAPAEDAPAPPRDGQDESDEPEANEAPAPPVRASHDFDCDGASDLILREGAFRYAVWVMEGERVARRIPLPLAAYNDDLVGAGDYDGNGCADLLWQDRYTKRLKVWLLDGGRLVSRHAQNDMALPSDEQWLVGGSADLDGDGIDDIALYSSRVGALEIWSMSGGEVREALRFPMRPGWTVPALVDSDGDEVAEVLCFDERSLQLEQLDPVRGLERPLWEMLPDWLPAGGGDFDGDGEGDVLVHRPGPGRTAMLRFDESKPFVERFERGVGELGGYGDFDGDGVDEVVWVDTETGIVTLGFAGGGLVEVDRTLPSGARLESARRSD